MFREQAKELAAELAKVCAFDLRVHNADLEHARSIIQPYLEKMAEKCLTPTRMEVAEKAVVEAAIAEVKQWSRDNFRLTGSSAAPARALAEACDRLEAMREENNEHLCLKGVSVLVADSKVSGVGNPFRDLRCHLALGHVEDSHEGQVGIWRWAKE